VIGQSIKRLEDAPLLKGQGRFVDDLHLPGMLEATFVRSSHAHARIDGIDATAARALEGVHAVYTLADLAPRLTSEQLPVGWPSATMRQMARPNVLAKDEVSYVGEPIAVVIATNRYVAEDAATLVEISYESLPAVSDCRNAIGQDAAKVRLGIKDNVLATFTKEYGNCDAAFAGAAKVFGLSLAQHKGCGHPIETRGVIAQYDPQQEALIVWSSTQVPHLLKQMLVELFGLDEQHIQVAAPDVGGGFGPKFICYPEEAVIAAASRELQRPIKWIEDRREHFVSTVQERDQFWDVEIAVDAGAKILGIRGKMIHDHGAFNALAINVPENAVANIPSVYVVPNFKMEVTVVLTNKVPVSAVRGAGHPQGTFVVERLLDLVAKRLDLDPAEVRRRNLIPAEGMPYRVPLPTRDGGFITYDSGNYPECLAKALEAADYEGFPARQASARAQGRYIGIGMANFVKGTGRGPYESATVRIGSSGKVLVYTGATAQGQGTKTALAQICASALGVDVNNVSVIAGNTASIPLGFGAFASRQIVTAGSSVHQAAVAVREKALKAASHLLEASDKDLEIEGDRVHVKGVPNLSVTLADVARALAGAPGFPMMRGVDPGLESTVNFAPERMLYCNGTHVAEVEVDIETGEVKILGYVVVNDSGRIINPMIVEGQLCGGVMHGIGNALFEWMGYDENAQPLTTTFAEYLLPTIDIAPNIKILHQESLSTLNPLGVKGVGESGTTPAPAALAAAVENALQPFKVQISEVPMFPPRLVELIKASTTEPSSRR